MQAARARQRTPSRLLLLVVLWAVGGGGVMDAVRCAHADTFDRHYRRGLALYQQKDFAGAVVEMSAAYDERQLPRLLLNIGQAYRKLGKAREALIYYERYLKADPDAPPTLQAEIRSYIAQSQALLEATNRQDALDRANEPAPVGWNRDSGQLLPEYAEKLRQEQRNRPLYKKPWFWAVIGVSTAAVIGIGVGIGVGVAKSRELPGGIDVLTF